MLNTMQKSVVLLVLVFSCMAACTERDKNMGLIESILDEQPDKFNAVLNDLDTYELQVIYTQIDRDENNNPTFTRHYFNVDTSRYFYPASTVKMPMAYMALNYINAELPEVDMYTTMLTDSAFSGQSIVYSDSSAENMLPSVAHYIKKIFLVSDNDAFNRLYELVGQEETLRMLHSQGFERSRIIHRLSIALSEEENRHTNPVRFMNGEDTLAISGPKYNEGPLPTSGSILKGIGYIGTNGLVNEPFDFGMKNFLPLEDLTDMLAGAIFPEQYPLYDMTPEQLKLVRTYMSQLPGESAYPSYEYDSGHYFDAYCKFLMYGSDPKVEIPDHIRIFNKIGLAYGYSTDIAYVIDTKNNIEFMLSATIHTNKNQIYNDGEYEYEETAFPFLRDLGQAIYDYELRRERQHAPDLTEFKDLEYK